LVENFCATLFFGLQEEIFSLQEEIFGLARLDFGLEKNFG